ncbi:MAG: potassium channel family protein [Actinomycetota bacterium]|nr:potassium channel family protein [Actinomycetota bacterium]
MTDNPSVTNPKWTPATRQLQWEQSSDTTLTAAAAVFLVAYAVEVLAPDLTMPWRRICDALQWLTWAAFVVDYVVRLALAPHRGRWFVRHLIDLLVVALPVLRPLRLLRLITVLEVLNRHAGSTLRGRVTTFVIGSTSLVVFVAALAELDVERGVAGSTINGFGSSLWWAATTITTVGYGDTYPVTSTGRLVSVGLMVCGIALLGIVTATLASWFVDRIREVDEQTAAGTSADLAELTTEVRALRAEIAILRASAAAGDDANALPTL